MTRKHKLYVFIALLVFVGLLYHYVLIMFVAQTKAGSAQQTFVSENQKLGDIPKILGVPDRPVSKTCTVDKNMHFRTELTCFADENYLSIGGYNPQRLYRFAPNILTSLKKNGWSADNTAELKNSDDKVSNVAYHKNVGPISCNLKIDYTKGTVYINYYYCSQTIKLPDLNLRQRTFGV